MMGQSVCLQVRKRAESPPMFISGKHQENQKDEGLRILKMRVRELFTHREGISTSRAHHKGRQPQIECANHDFKIMYFPFLCFLLFWGRQGYCPCSYVSSGTMRKSNLRSSLSLKVCVLNYFYTFERLILNFKNNFYF